MADLSKVKVLGSEYNLKDAKGRADMATLLGDEALRPLGAAAWKAVATEVSKSADLPTAEAVKSYVDSAVGKIHNFDVVIDPAGTAAGPSVVASADTMYKIYLVPTGEATAGEYIEYITIKSGDGEAATFKWEPIGSTKTNLTGYVPTTTTIATIKLDHNITVAELQTALGLGAMAYVATASGEVEGQTISGVKATGTLTAGLTGALGAETAAATIVTKADYTPAGSITGEAISGGSINVTLKDATETTNAVIAASSTFTPAGTVAAVAGGDFQALKSATFQEDESGVAIEGTVSAPVVNLTSSTVDVAVGIKGGSVASIDTDKFSGGSFKGATQASFTQGSKASFTQGSKAAFSKGTAVGAAIEGVVASVGASDSADAETLILTAATTHDVIGHTEASFTANGDDIFVANGDDSFTPNTVGTFTPAALAAGFFTPNVLQQADMGTVNNVTAAALANNPVFTGNKYKIATTADTALKTVAFTATNNVSVPTQITYVKQEVDAKTFNPVPATLEFSGTTSEQLIPTAINYSKTTIGTLGASAALPAGGLDVGDITVTAKNVTVSPDGK